MTTIDGSSPFDVHDRSKMSPERLAAYEQYLADQAAYLEKKNQRRAERNQPPLVPRVKRGVVHPWTFWKLELEGGFLLRLSAPSREEMFQFQLVVHDLQAGTVIHRERVFLSQQVDAGITAEEKTTFRDRAEDVIEQYLDILGEDDFE